MNDTPEQPRQIRKFNPGTFQSDEELIDQFVVRNRELETVMNVLRGNAGAPSCQHLLTVAPRGRGKTMLLARVAAELRADTDLSRQFLPVRFMEESHEIFDLCDFWLESLFYLSQELRAPVPELSQELREVHAALRTERHGRELEGRARAAVLDAADRLGKQLVVMVENLQTLCTEVDRDFASQLRQVLQSEPQIILFATATSRFRALDDAEHPFFELFRIVHLEPLTSTECRRLWQMMTGVDVTERSIRPLEILTGGDPRLLVIVGEFAQHHSMRQLMEDLVRLIDNHTEYFRAHLEGFAKTERRVYLALIDLWQPSTTGEVVDRARLDVRTVSSLLGRLVDRGAVIVEGKGRKRLYAAAQRLYSIYYKLRRERDEAAVVRNLIHFLSAYYSPSELREFGRRILQEATGLDEAGQLPYRTAFGSLVELPSLAPHREELISLAPAIWRSVAVADEERALKHLPSFLEKAIRHLVEGRLQAFTESWKASVRDLPPNSKAPDLDRVAFEFLNRIARAVEPDRQSDAFSSWTDMAEMLGVGDTPAADDALAWTGRAFTLLALERPEEALAASGEALKLVVDADTPTAVLLVASPLVAEGLAYTSLNRCEEALAAWDRMERLSSELHPARAGVLKDAAGFLKVTTFLRFDRLDEASTALDELLRQFPDPAVQVHFVPIAELVARIWATSGHPGGTERAIMVCDLFIARFTSSEDPSMSKAIADVFARKGALLVNSNKPEEALLVLDEALYRFDSADTEELPELTATTLFNKGIALSELSRHEEAVSAWDQLLERLGSGSTQHELFFAALLVKADRLVAIGRLDQALTVCDDAIENLEAKNDPASSYMAAIFRLDRAGILLRLQRFEEALRGWEPVLRPPEPTDTPEMIHAISKALADKGIAFNCLNRPREALAAFEEVLEHVDSGQWPDMSVLVSWAHSHRSHALVRLGRLDEALAAANEALERSGSSDAPDSLYAAEVALGSKLQAEMELGLWEAAISTVDRLLGRRYGLMPVNRWKLHLARAKAFLSMGDKDTYALNVQAALLILSVLRPIPGEALRFLSRVAFEMEPALMRDLIRASPAAELLLPLTAALERELGLDPRIPREVEEVAEDIRRDFAKPQNTKPA